MTEPTTTPSGSEYRVVTVADLRHELQREQLITDAQLGTISNQITALDLRFSDFREDTVRRTNEASENMNRRFAEAKENTSQRFTAVDQRFITVDQRFAEAKANMDQQFTAVDQRFAEAKTNTDQRFDQMEKLFLQIGKRFDELDERLRFNKTLVVASISAVASAASVAVSLLR